MSIETKCFCDMCGAVRGATNHWFMVETFWSGPTGRNRGKTVGIKQVR